MLELTVTETLSYMSNKRKMYKRLRLIKDFMQNEMIYVQ